MPLKLADLRKETRAVTFPFAGESVTVVYRPRLLSPVLRVQLLGGAGMFLEGEEAERVTLGRFVEVNREYCAALAGLLESWDVLGDDGEPLPATAEWLEQFDAEFVRALVAAIVQDQRVDPRNGETSRATSPVAD